MQTQVHQRRERKNKQKSVSSTDDQNVPQKLTHQSEKNGPRKYKTQMCKNFSEVGHCPYFQKCQFAHGSHELHQPITTPKKFYRTKPCKPFWEKGSCSYGFRCQFSHYKEESGQEQLILLLMKQYSSKNIEGRSRLFGKEEENEVADK